MATASINDLVAAYRESAQGTSTSDPKIANQWQRKMHACYTKLRDTIDGRAGIMALMADPSPHVRCWAAAHSLQWDAVHAKKTLQDLRDSKGRCSFDAEMTLTEFDKGRLSFDY